MSDVKPFNMGQAIAALDDEMERVIADEIRGVGYREMKEQAKRIAKRLRDEGYGKLPEPEPEVQAE